MEILVKDVSKIIKGVSILENVNLELHGGMIYGLQGANGSGKTMLMRLVAGLIRPTSGNVFINGWMLGKDRDFPPSMGLLIESPAFLPGYTGYKNLALLASLRGIADIDQVRTAILDVGLDPNDPRKYRKYSLGMKQRLAIAAAIMEWPDLILLDEPTNALDDEGVRQICTLLRHERERGALIIMACHDVSLLEGLADEIYTVIEGKIARKATK